MSSSARKRNTNHKRTLKQLHEDQFADLIARNVKFHKKEAMEWSERQDWDALKDEFEERSDKGHYGRPFVHSTVEAFAKFRAKNEDVERWIIKSIGPTPMREIEWKGDWAVDRAVKRVKDMLHAQQLQEKLSQDTGLMKVAAPVAASYRTWMEEPERMRDAVIGYLGGTILESKPKKWDRMTLKLKKKWRERQEHRLDFYATWLERILVYKAKVDNHYLGTLGYNKPNYYSVMQNLILSKQNNGGNGGLPNGGSDDARELSAFNLMRGLFSMETEKAKIFDVPLPDDYQQVVDKNTIDTEATEVDDEDSKVKSNGKHRS